MGRIGLAVAQRAHFGFNMPVLYNARSQHKAAEERFGAKKCELDELLAKSDFVCVLLPLTEQTFHTIGKEQLAKMKSSAILISAGRGPVIDEKALIAALKEGTIHAAGMDVFEHEPLPKARSCSTAKRRGAATYGFCHPRNALRHGRLRGG